MRIIAGRWRGKHLTTPDGRNTRPTSDRARCALFNLLLHGKPSAAGFRLAGARVLDAFAGTGAVGLEALSRGAAHVTFIENSPEILPILRRNIEVCDAADVNCRVITSDIAAPPRAERACDMIFMDPPYGRALWRPAMSVLVQSGWMTEEAICCIELGRQEEFEAPSGFELLDDRHYGAARMTVLKRQAGPGATG